MGYALNSNDVALKLTNIYILMLRGETPHLSLALLKSRELKYRGLYKSERLPIIVNQPTHTWQITAKHVKGISVGHKSDWQKKYPRLDGQEILTIGDGLVVVAQSTLTQQLYLSSGCSLLMLVTQSQLATHLEQALKRMNGNQPLTVNTLSKILTIMEKTISVA